MYILDKDKALKLARVLSTDYYQKFVDYLVGVLRASRDRRNRFDSQKILSIQYALLKYETDIWDLIREGRKKAKTLRTKKKLTSKEQVDLRGIEDHIFIHEQIIRISQTIIDGIAWRCLNFNRTILSSSCRGFGTGAVDIRGKSNDEFEWALQILQKFNSTVLINDLTRYLRIGDLIEIRPDKKVLVHEVKGKKISNVITLSRKKKNKLSEQEKRLIELQNIIIMNDAVIDGEVVRTQQMKTQLKTHINKLKILINKSYRQGNIYVQVEPFLTIEITNYFAIGKNKTEIEEIKKNMYEHDANDLILVHSNWDSFFNDEKGNFLRAMPPFSIFPLSSKDSTYLMSGHYCVKTFLDINKLKSSFIKAGYAIEETTDSELDKQIKWFEDNKQDMFLRKKSLYANVSPEAGLFTIHRGPFSLRLTAVHYSKLTSEYVTFKSFLEMVDEMYELAKTKRKNDAYFPRFSNEHTYWV